MALMVKFIDGTERRFDADSACLEDHDRLFVLAKYNSKKRGEERSDTFPSEQLVRAKFEDGRIVFGKGRIA